MWVTKNRDTMFKGLLQKVFGDKNKKDLQELEPYVDLINTEYAKLANLSNDELRMKTKEFKNKCKINKFSYSYLLRSKFIQNIH